MPVINNDPPPTPINHHQLNVMASEKIRTVHPIKPKRPASPMIEGKMRIVLWYSKYALIFMAEHKKSAMAIQKR